MTVRATQKYIRISPRKLREVASLVRGRSLPEANDLLTGLNKVGAKVINETIRQAVANAVNNLGHSETDLTMTSLLINEGPRYKRFRAGSRGRAKPYVKRTAHVTVELTVAASAQPVKKAAPKKIEEPKTEDTAKKGKSISMADQARTTSGKVSGTGAMKGTKIVAPRKTQKKEV
jgi:large subunit ribosomal protein L22